MVNTETGSNYLHTVSGNLVMEQVPLEWGVTGNSCLTKPTKLTEERKRFFEALQTLPFEKTVLMFMTPTLKQKIKYWVKTAFPILNIILRKIKIRIIQKYEEN
jgi:ribosomal protein S3AE